MSRVQCVTNLIISIISQNNRNCTTEACLFTQLALSFPFVLSHIKKVQFRKDARILNTPAKSVDGLVGNVFY